MIWDFSLEEIVSGYADKEGSYECVMCGKSYQKGKIYTFAEELLDAYGSILAHIHSEHSTTADFLLGQSNELTGISDVQQHVLQLISEGKSDKEIAAIVGIASSTVRNHRFKFREKEKQAKLFLSLMQSLAQKQQSNIAFCDQGNMIDIHASATMIDDRYAITQKEYDKTVKTYMDDCGALKQFPAKEKNKIIVLCEIMKCFKKGQVYSETEINRILKRIFEEDYVTIRRALIEYGFMDRSDDCKVYRVKE